MRPPGECRPRRERPQSDLRLETSDRGANAHESTLKIAAGEAGPRGGDEDDEMRLVGCADWAYNLLEGWL